MSGKKQTRSTDSKPTKTLITEDLKGSRNNEISKAPVDENEKYRNFIEKLPVLFYAVKPDPPYDPIYVSPAFEIFGFPLDEWIGTPDIWLQVIHEDDRQRIFDLTVESTRTGQNVQYEYRVKTADGSVRWVRDRGCLIRDELGQVTHRQGVIVDITLSKLAEQEVEKREKLYRTLAKNIPGTAVLLFDRDFRYTLADGQQLNNHAYSQQMFENKTIWDVFPADIVDEWLDYYRRALEGEHIS